jgi:hypothetical protein
MRRAAATLLCLTAWLAVVGSAQAAKTYNDPWLEGDLEQIRVPEALDILARTPQHVIVGDVDSGALLSDPDLAPHLVQMTGPYNCASEYGPGPDYLATPANGDFGCDFIGNGDEGVPSTFPDGQPFDPFGHGTGTAAIIGAVVNNGVGGAGVAPNARVLPVRACYGGNPDCFAEPALAGLTYAVAMGASVINDSWPPENGAVYEGFIHANANVLFVFAIGGDGQNNEPFDICTHPGTFPNVVCVGLANADDSAGTVDAQTTTDVSAPGSAGVPTATGAHGGFGYTSGATAHVTGAAALLRGLAPTLSAATIRQVLMSTSRQVAGYQTANKAGGIIDVEAAVRAVQQMEGLATPVPGHGAAADIPDPFAAQATANPPVGPPTPKPKPTPTPNSTGGPKISLKGLPHSVHAGETLKLELRISGGTGTVKATLTHKKETLAKATRRHASGKFTLPLQLPKKAKLGPAKLAVKIGKAKPIVKSITVLAPK